MVRPTGIELVSSAPQADKWCAQQESNLYLQLRRLTLYPLSYGRKKFSLLFYYSNILTFLKNIYKNFHFYDDKTYIFPAISTGF